ncbi:MAG: hypothetical protein IH851_13925, partial [Armatimonadetes bacterium]|nr:hypothetical protein [Armatimonadota bacterium]
MSRLRGVSAKIMSLPRAQWARLRATLRRRPPSDRRAGSTTLGGATNAYGIRVLTGAIAAVALLAVIVPWSPGIIDVQDVRRLAIDLSALMVLADAFADGKRFGVDVVFPYGPLSFVRHNIFHPGTFDWLIALRLLLWTGYGLVALRIATQARTHGAWCGTLVATVFVFCWLFGFLKEPAFLIAPILLQLLYVQDIASNSGRLRPATVLFVLCGAVLAYVKFSYFLGFALQLLLFAVVDIGIRRRWPVLSLVGFAALLAVWSVIGQRFGDLGAWLITSFDLSRGFNLEAGLAGLKQGRWAEVLLLLLSAGVGVLLQAIWMARKTEDLRLTAILTLGTAGSAFIIFKYGVVRHDAHAAFSATAFAGLIVIQMLLFFQGARSSLKLAAAPAIVAVLGFNVWIVGNWDLPLPLPSAVLRKVETGLAALALGDRRDRLNTRYVAAQKHMAGLLPLEKPEGTVDVITNNPGIAIVNGWKLANRPSFLTQQTVSARSSRMNAAFLDSDAAPDTIVAMLHFSDQRYPGMSDPLLWLKLLEHYRVKSWRGEVVVLSRRDEPARLKRAPIATFTGKLNTTFDIPKEARKRLVWAEIDLRPSFIGSLINLIYKLPPPSIVVHTGDGAEENYRLVHYAARAGFLFSPTLPGPIPLISMETRYQRPPIPHVVDSF